MTQAPPSLIDRGQWLRARGRAARTIADAGFLHAEVAEQFAERLAEVNRSFPRALVFGSAHGATARAVRGRFGIETLVEQEPSSAMAALTGAMVVDERLAPEHTDPFDLILSPLLLHMLDDPVGALVRIRMALKPDGLFLGALPCGASLSELREALAEAEITVENGLSPRVAPMADLRDLGALLQRAGFALPVADADLLTVEYPHPLALMRDLRAMGETNALAHRRKGPLKRAVLAEALRIYGERFALPSGRVKASFEIAYLTGWAPHPDQPKPLRPGSASARLADALGTIEIPTGEKPG